MAKRLLDRALDDYKRAERLTQNYSTSAPLYLPEIRWEMVRAARQLLGE